MYWGEPFAMRLLLSVQDPSKRATLETLREALDCEQEDDHSECHILLQIEIKRFVNSSFRSAAAIEQEEKELKRKLDEYELKAAEVRKKLGDSKDRYSTHVKMTESEMEEMQLEKLKFEAKLASLNEELQYEMHL